MDFEEEWELNRMPSRADVERVAAELCDEGELKPAIIQEAEQGGLEVVFTVDTYTVAVEILPADEDQELAPRVSIRGIESDDIERGSVAQELGLALAERFGMDDDDEDDD